MFGVDTSELLVVAVVALLFIGPKDLPRVMMKVGRWVGKVRGYARHFTAGIENVIREAELEEMEKKWREENQRILAQYPADAIYPEPVPTAPDGAPMTALPEDQPTLPLEAPAAPDDDPTPARRAAAAMISDIDDSKAPLLDHLIELRRRLLWCVATLLVGFFVCLYFAKPIFAVLVQPLLAAGQGKLIYTDIFEAFFVEVKVAFFAALMISFPVLATQIWRFVAPGLYAKEKRAFLPFLLMTPVLLRGRRGLRLFRRHAVGAEVPARLRGRCRRGQPGSAAGDRQLPQLRHALPVRLRGRLPAAGAADGARARRASSRASSWPSRAAMRSSPAAGGVGGADPARRGVDAAAAGAALRASTNSRSWRSA